ncbi:UDP-glycosyltransferase 87A1-like [Panicum miliaceum]|uniref:UDP-glycosyltransferase 87A1-like n=1 Tax=Panicum miliaceum TaxID=4540 RepID=A0A3L6R2V2_PANMI|nr:UDP-glycosyltransferase 87A1-like [Panicum miliaceum]
MVSHEMALADASLAVDRRPCHIVALPYPDRGHINPTLSLCRLLAARRSQQQHRRHRCPHRGVARPAWRARTVAARIGFSLKEKMRSHGLIGTEEMKIVLAVTNLMSVNASDSKEVRRRANSLKGASRELKRGDLRVVISITGYIY